MSGSPLGWGAPGRVPRTRLEGVVRRLRSPFTGTMRLPTGPSWPAALALLLFLARPAAPAAAQQSLREVVDSVVGAWSRGDARALAAWMPAEGIELHLRDESHPRLGIRQVRAALERLLDEGGEGRAVLGRVQTLDGAPRAGFAELHWSPDEPTAFAAYAVFVGFREMEGRWRIYQIRLLPDDHHFNP